ncbi:MAG: hypothetical protein RLZZ294_668 [Bacteroidota bacterium]|jgi:hypothetical protein
MIRPLIILCILFNAALFSSAQDPSIKLWSDQQVFLTGEDMWIEGILQNAKPASRSLILQLLDRNGNRKTDVEVQYNGNKFRALITVPSNLPSDYYFLDAFTSGLSVKTALFPVMIIHPKIPPSIGCAFTSRGSEQPFSEINIYTDKDIYSPRSEVKLSLTGLTEIQHGNITVVKTDELNVIYEQAIKGFNAMREHAEWKEQENEGKLFTFYAKKDGKPVSNLSVLAAWKSRSSHIAIGNTDEKGVLKLLFPFKFEATEIVLHAMSNEKSIIFEAYAPFNTNPIEFPCLKIDETTRFAIESRLLNLNVTKQFYSDLHRKPEYKTTDTADFYGKPDIRYYLDDYVRFPNMEEVIAEIISEVRVKKEKDHAILQVLNIPFKYFFTNEPLIMVDGIPYFNTKELLESDPLLIKSIDVINRKYIVGTHEFEGIVHFKTYRNDMGSLKKIDSDKSFPTRGLQISKSLEPAFQGNYNTTMPDFRNIVFKKNDIQSDFRGTAVMPFKLSDAIGDYNIIFRGLDKAGNTQLASKSIRINY